MYTRIFKFFINSNLFYPLQFGFRQNYSTTHALTNLTETIRKYLDEGKFACGIFVDLEKAFGKVEHNILLTKLEHYGVRDLQMIGLSHTYMWRETVCFNKELSNILGFNKWPWFKLGFCFVWCTSKFSPWFSFIFDICQWLHSDYVKLCKVNYFVDYTNLLHFSKSVTKLDKYINPDKKNLTDWLNANKISLNVQKTVLLIFKHQRKEVKLFARCSLLVTFCFLLFARYFFVQITVK